MQEWRDAEELLEGTADGAGITGASHGNIEGGGIGGAGVGTLLFDLREAYLEVTYNSEHAVLYAWLAARCVLRLLLCPVVLVRIMDNSHD